MSQINSRRQFVKLVLGASGIALLAPKAVFGAEGRRRTAPAAGAAPAAGGELPLVKPGEGMAASVHYVHNKNDLKDASLKVDRQGTPFAKQGCATCMLFTPDGKQGGEAVGKCTLFNGQHVKATGWCASWSKKA